MSVISTMSIGFGIVFVILGLYFLYKQYSKPVPDSELVWAGLGKNPFRKE